MKRYQHVIFDLDGTLSDSRSGILNSALYALDQMNIKNPPVKELNELIGVPLQEYFREIFSFKDDQVNEAVYHFRKYYGEKGAFENIVYPGIPELLGNLKSAGKKIYISTAKLEKYAWLVADHFDFSPLLTDLVGADADGKHATKTELTASVIERNKITDLQNTVVIGDKYMDIEAGYNNKIDSIGVTYGYGSVEEIQKANPTYIANSVEELSLLITT